MKIGARRRLLAPLLMAGLSGCAASLPPSEASSPAPQQTAITEIYRQRHDQLEAETAEKRRRIDVIAAAQKKVLVPLIACQDVYAARLAATTPESPSDIVLATFSACASFDVPVRKLQREMDAIGGLGPDSADQFMNSLGEASRERLTKKIIETRSVSRQKE